jgi:hypothetical protein
LRSNDFTDHRFAGAEDRTADRLARERRFLQLVEDDVVRRVLGRADFLHDHALLALQFLGIEGRVRQDVGQHVDCQRHVGAQHARIK